jgi:hypothetical protein
MSGELGNLSSVPKDAYFIRDFMQEVTGASYEVRTPTPEFPPPADGSTWFVASSILEETAKTTYATLVWMDRMGNLLILSNDLGSSTDFVARQYGEDGVISARRFDYSDFNSIRKSFAEMFPKVDQELEGYERETARVSAEKQLDLTVRCFGEKGVGLFSVQAKIRVDNPQPEKLKVQIRENVDGLREVWEQIQRLRISKKASLRRQSLSKYSGLGQDGEPSK